mgnify:FL=1
MNLFKRILPDIVVIILFAVISFVYFFPAVTEGRVLSQHDAVAGIGAGEESKDTWNVQESVHAGQIRFLEVCLLIRWLPATILRIC